MGLRNVIGNTMKSTWTHTIRHPSARLVTYERRLEKLWHFPYFCRATGKLRAVYDRAFRIDRRAFHYFFFSLSSFATRFTVVPVGVHGLICPRNVHRPFSMIDRPRDKRESTVVAITVIILALAVAFYAPQQFFFPCIKCTHAAQQRGSSLLGRGKEEVEGRRWSLV